MKLIPQFPSFYNINMLHGILAALVTFSLWGISPLYWNLLGQVPQLQLLAHRILWSFVLCFLVVLAQGTSALTHALTQACTLPTLRRHGLAAVFIAGNWALYVWAVSSGFVSQASLGDYILPLVTVLLGVVFLSERLHRLQWLAIGLATLGLCVVSLGYGIFPWVSIVLGLCEALYSFAKTKATALSSIQGVAFEMGLLLLPAVAYIVVAEVQGEGMFGHADSHTLLLLVGSGVLTALPLVTLSFAVQRLPLTLVGVLVYVTPTIEVLLAAFAFHEHFSTVTLLGFGLVWLALLVFSVQSYRNHRHDLAIKQQLVGGLEVVPPLHDTPFVAVTTPTAAIVPKEIV
ncbi:Aste57867_6814 [Aphanomyces stellatus]|uniref:Aste57867_6814 protein n=1 Tax=Aphanomyces stellatus TaxID=120398 RepID=A0A485KHC9_9STRA|nr:hypothetical protein As57867_006794 [Aphanomyces stellatus]VFT83778.1 Aste57867_6814 [Aphanomyces stellatus]